VSKRLKFTVRHAKPLAAVLVLLACAGVAFADGDGGSGALRACAAKRGGQLRLLTHGACKRSERAVAWNAAGRPGARGSAGAAGRAGSTGKTGATGATGMTGPSGTARAYAHVITFGSGAPKFDPARTVGFTSVAYAVPNGENDGTYCLTADAGISPATTAAIVAPDWQDAYAGEAGFAYLDLTDSDCAAGEFEVQTYVGTPPTPAHTIDFNIVVP
jgi:hypothetical protein